MKTELCANAKCHFRVVMKPSIDDRYLVGICKSCGTKVIERKSASDYKSTDYGDEKNRQKV